jgi:hypothetical protein
VPVSGRVDEREVDALLLKVLGEKWGDLRA